MPLALVLLAASLAPRDTELPLDREVAVHVATDAQATFELRVASAGTLYVWADSTDADPRLVLVAGDGTDSTDDDSGGGTCALLRVPVEGAGEFRLSLALQGAPEGGAEVVLHAALRSGIEPALLDDANAMLADGRSLAPSDVQGARALFAEATELLLTGLVSERDETFADRAAQIGISAHQASDPETASLALEAACEAYSAVLPRTSPSWRGTHAD